MYNIEWKYSQDVSIEWDARARYQVFHPDL
jgi:hypothetical protein